MVNHLKDPAIIPCATGPTRSHRCPQKVSQPAARRNTSLEYRKTFVLQQRVRTRQHLDNGGLTTCHYFLQVRLLVTAALAPAPSLCLMATGPPAPKGHELHSTRRSHPMLTPPLGPRARNQDRKRDSPEESRSLHPVHRVNKNQVQLRNDIPQRNQQVGRRTIRGERIEQRCVVPRGDFKPCFARRPSVCINNV